MEIAVLRSMFLFKGLPDRILAEVAALATTETYAVGTRIFDEGSHGEHLYLIQKGKVRISKTIQGMGEEALAILGEGDYFGEMALIDDAPRSADAIADKTVVLWAICRADFQGLLARNKLLAYELLWGFVRTLSSRLRETNAKMTFLAAAGRFV